MERRGWACCTSRPLRGNPRLEPNIPSYLVEAYVPRSQAQDARVLGHRASVAAARLSREGMPVRYVRTTFVPDDETCFHLFEAESQDVVGEVCRRAGIFSARIVAAVE
jgi:hypothetical protein